MSLSSKQTIDTVSNKWKKMRDKNLDISTPAMDVNTNLRNIKSQFISILLALIKYQLTIYNRKLYLIIIILWIVML